MSLSAAYRIRQFIWALKARIEPGETLILDQYLNAAEKKLFLAMEVQDQRHSLNVFYQLTNRGYSDVELLKAALLHDVGKAGAGLGTFHRVVIVALKPVWPGLLKTIASPNRRSWGYPFWVHRNHGRIGAELVAGAGGSDRLVALVRQHQGPGCDPLAQALYEADGVN